MKRCIAVALLSLSALPSWANDAAVRGVGGTVAPMDEHPSVRMIRERVDAKVRLDGAMVRCEFVFKNEGPSTTVKIGFPEEASGEADPIKKTDFIYFRSFVDGKRVQTRFIPSAGEEDTDYQAWHVKDVHFASGQTRTIVNEYRSYLGENSMGDRFFYYVLRTGKSWKGKIGEAVITVDVSAIPAFWRAQAQQPPKSSVTGGRIEWVLKDFEPLEDVFVSIEPNQRVFMGGPAEGMQVTSFDPDASGKYGITIAPVSDLDREGCAIKWDARNREGVITFESKTIRLRPGSKVAVANDGSENTLTAAPFISDGRLYAPIVEVAKALGMNVTYDPKTKFISIFGKRHHHPMRR